jgi:hypothetical protein
VLLRCCGSPLGRQKDQALVVSAALYEPGLLGVADRLFKVSSLKAEVAAHAVSPPPGMRAGDAEAMELGDERRRALETVLGDHRPMVRLRRVNAPTLPWQSSLTIREYRCACPSCACVVLGNHRHGAAMERRVPAQGGVSVS